MPEGESTAYLLQPNVHAHNSGIIWVQDKNHYEFPIAKMLVFDVFSENNHLSISGEFGSI